MTTAMGYAGKHRDTGPAMSYDSCWIGGQGDLYRATSTLRRSAYGLEPFTVTVGDCWEDDE